MADIPRSDGGPPRKLAGVDDCHHPGLLAVVAAAAYALATSGTASSEETRRAPDFTLPTTAGTTVTLSELRGDPVILYFNEGAGCASCTVQMAEIEKEPGFAAARRSRLDTLTTWTFLTPVLGIALAAVLLGERPGGWTAAGLLAVLVAMWIALRSPRRTTTPAPATGPTDEGSAQDPGPGTSRSRQMATAPVLPSEGEP